MLDFAKSIVCNAKAIVTKVGNAKDKNGKELRIGDIVAVKTSDPSLNHGKIVRISGDQVSVDVTGDDDIWTTPARLTVKMGNSKVNYRSQAINSIPDSQINGPSAAEIREIAGRVYKTDMRKDDLARAVSFELAKKYKSFQTNSHIMDMVSEVLSKFKIGNETMHEWATSKPKSVGNSAYDDGVKKGKEDKRNGKLITAAGFDMHVPGFSKYSYQEREEFKKGYYSSNDLTKDDIYKSWKTGNTKVINSDREFFKELADDAKKREKKYDADIEKVGNREIYVNQSEQTKAVVYEDGTIMLWDKNGNNYKTIKADSLEKARKKLNSDYKKVGNAKCGNSYSDKIPTAMDYRKALDEIIEKKNLTPDEARRKYGQFTYAQWEKELGHKIGNSEDDKFAYVMREFDEGKLKTPDGKVVTDPAQAKAIAYSESKKTENGLARARNAMAKNKKVKNSAVREYKHSDGRVAQIDFNEDGTDADMSIYEGTKEIEQKNFSTIRDAEQYVTSHGFRRI